MKQTIEAKQNRFRNAFEVNLKQEPLEKCF